MSDPKWRRGSTLAVLAALLVVGAMGMGRAGSAPSLADLLASDAQGYLEFTLVFRPLDCQLPVEIIEELNELALAKPGAVRGIMLGPIPEGDDLDVLLRGLRITFPLEEDANGFWSDALIAESIPNPTLFIYRDGRRYASISLEGLRTLRRYLPRTARALSLWSS